MNIVVRQPLMTRDQFLDWAERQEAPYEFDGFAPVLMTGGNRNHARACSNLVFALRSRLKGTACEVLPEAGVATIGNAVRYPDALITCTQGPGTDRLMPDVIAVFEAISPTSGRTDRIIKLREYRAVPSIRRYVILDNLGPDLTVFSRLEADQDWTATALSAGDTLDIPEVGIAVPVNEFYDGVALPEYIDEGR